MSGGMLGKVYQSGSILMREGEAGDCMLVLQEGEVEILIQRDGREVLLRKAGKGEILGEMAIFDRAPRSATVRAIGEVRALTVDKKTLLQRMNEDPSIAFRIFESMSRRIRDLNLQVEKLSRPSSGDLPGGSYSAPVVQQ